METDYGRLRTALITLAELAWTAWRREGFPELLVGRVWDPELLQKLLPLPGQVDELEFPKASTRHRVFLLPPTGDALACFLSVKWNFALDAVDRGERELDPDDSMSRTFRLFMMPAAHVGSVPPTVFRFDEGEGASGDSWCFAHAQLCDRLLPYDNWFRSEGPAWVSATLPRIPLAHRGSAPILVALLVGLYGIRSDVTRKVLSTLRDRQTWEVAKNLGWRP